MRSQPKSLEKPGKVQFEEDLLEHYLEEIQSINNYTAFPEIEFNPFLCNLNSLLKMGYKTEKNINGVARAEAVVKSTGEIVPVSAPIRFGRVQVVDQLKFIKIYQGTIKDMFSLSGPAIKIYGYFIQQMMGKPNVTEVYFRLQDCISFTGYASKSTIYMALSELIKAGFIAKTNRPPSFYINPLYAFNGDMIETYNRYILEGSPAEDEFDNSQKAIEDKNDDENFETNS